MKQVYQYQNYGKTTTCGDFNSRIGDESDYIEGVNNIPVRQVIDTTSNKHGDHLLDFLIDCNMCVVNGRLGLNDSTHVSHRECSTSVVNYVIVTHEQLSVSTHFSIHRMSEVINDLNLHGCDKISDHSVLVCEVALCNQDQDQDSLLVKRRNDNHSPGPVIRELVPSSHQRSELLLCIFSG